jgi:hypothetical protein
VSKALRSRSRSRSLERARVAGRAVLSPDVGGGTPWPSTARGPTRSHSGDTRDVAEVPYYAEGINVIGDDVYVTHESGASAYQGEHGETRIQHHDLDDLGLDR